eukprot:7387783-Prymnesium_polylepis.3
MPCVGKRRAEVTVTARVRRAAERSCLKGVHHGERVPWAGVGRCEALDQPPRDEGCCIFVPEEMIKERLCLVLGVANRRPEEGAKLGWVAERNATSTDADR